MFIGLPEGDQRYVRAVGKDQTSVLERRWTIILGWDFNANPSHPDDSYAGMLPKHSPSQIKSLCKEILRERGEDPDYDEVMNDA